MSSMLSLTAYELFENELSCSHFCTDKRSAVCSVMKIKLLHLSRSLLQSQILPGRPQPFIYMLLSFMRLFIHSLEEVCGRWKGWGGGGMMGVKSSPSRHVSAETLQALQRHLSRAAFLFVSDFLFPHIFENRHRNRYFSLSCLQNLWTLNILLLAAWFMMNIWATSLCILSAR